MSRTSLAVLFACCLAASSPRAARAQPSTHPLKETSPSAATNPEDAAREQNAVISKYHLEEYPDLSAAGLRLAEGAYQWDAAHLQAAPERPYPSADELGSAIEDTLLKGDRDTLRRERLEDLKRLLPNPEARDALGGATDRQLRFLQSYLSAHPEEAKPFENTALLKFLAKNLSRSDEDGFGVLSAFFENHDAKRGAETAPMDQPEVRHRMMRGHWDSSNSYRSFNNFGGRGLSIAAPPSPSGTWSAEVTVAIADPNFSPIQMDDSDISNLLRKGDPQDISKVRARILPLTEFKSPRTRSKALQVLSLLHDESLTPLFLKHLNDDDSLPRNYAARAIASILGTYKASSPGADWSVYLEKAPALLSSLALNTSLFNYEASHAIVQNLGYMNLMGEKQKEAFVGGFQDPQALLLLIGGTSANNEVDHDRGLHSSEAKVLYRRFKETSGGEPLSRFLGRYDTSARRKVIARLQRYDLLAGELKADPALAGTLEAAMFPTTLMGMSSEEMFALGKLLWQNQGSRFAQDILDRIQAPKDFDFNRQAAILYLILNERSLTAKQKDSLRSFSEELPLPAQKALQDRRNMAFYARWPRGGMDVALLMTQAEHAYEFIRTLERHGFQRVGRSRGKEKVERIEFVRNARGGAIRLHLDVFPSSAGGWVSDKPLLQAMMADRYRDPKYQVVVYRGHGQEYAPKSLATLPSKDKVFIDLSCGSSYSAKDALSQCEDCAHFATTTTGVGTVNNVFLAEVLDLLADRATFPQMQARLETRLPRTAWRFTGTWSGAAFWADTLGLMTMGDVPVRLRAQSDHGPAVVPVAVRVLAEEALSAQRIAP